MRRSLIGVLVALVVGSMLGGVPAVASSTAGKAPSGSDIRHFDGKVSKLAKPSHRIPARSGGPAYGVGTVKYWLALDDYNQQYYMKPFTLRALEDHIEVWVANDTDFPAGDCRNGVRTDITDQQVQYLVDEFNNNMYPIESALFSTPIPQNGENQLLDDFFGLPSGYYKGKGARIVTLVDNVRDDNYYDTNNSNGFSYIAGFYSGALDFYIDRNIMTIDAFDWLHRTGANPPNDPVPGNNCTSAPARPFLYEGVFAHEYQHLLEADADPIETTWMNEGMSDYAAYATGYFDPMAPVTDLHFDSHTQCILGWNGVQTPANPNPRPGGPENGLTVWGDQNFDHEQEILCDYGAAATYMLFLAQHYGEGLIHHLHNDAATQGLPSVAEHTGQTYDEVLQGIAQFWATLALDGVLDDGATLAAGESDYQVDALHALINWDTDDAYDTPGAPPNGADFVRLRNGSGDYIGAGPINNITFDGVTELDPQPIAWTVDGGTGNPAPSYFSDADDNLDNAMVREVTVDGDHTLEFDINHNTEIGYDWMYVQVSTDGGDTYQSITCDGMNATGSLGPAYEGDSGGFFHDSCDLSAYAGQTIAISFRYVTDGGVVEPGVWLDNIDLGGSLGDGSSLAGWMSPTEYNPPDVTFLVQLIMYRNNHAQPARIGWMELDGNNDGELSGAELDAVIGTKGAVVGALVTYLAADENLADYAGYNLWVNGVLQPGGSV